MNSFRAMKRIFILSLTLLVSSGILLADQSVLSSYDKLLPLEGGSNFRDMGGYVGADGKHVVKGRLFRSGAPSSLTQKDMDYLDQFEFGAVVDLRSSEELDLYPNLWVTHSDIEYRNVDYSITELMGKLDGSPESMRAMAAQTQPDTMYRNFPTMLKPQLTLLFDSLLNEDAPVLVSCSAGQDRTGVATGLVLTLLGVDRETIFEDYLLSTKLRRPVIERGDVDLEEAAKTNAFAAVMLSYGGNEEPVATPLYMEDGTPFLYYTFDEIENTWGSVEAYADQELGVDAKDVAILRTKYLK